MVGYFLIGVLCFSFFDTERTDLPNSRGLFK